MCRYVRQRLAPEGRLVVEKEVEVVHLSWS